MNKKYVASFKPLKPGLNEEYQDPRQIRITNARRETGFIIQSLLEITEINTDVIDSNAEPALLPETATCIESRCGRYRAVRHLLLLETIGVQGALSFVRHRYQELVSCYRNR